MSDELLGKVDASALALLELARQGGTNEEKIPYPERVVAFREVAKWAEFRAKNAPKAPVAEPKIAELRSRFHGTNGASTPKRRRTAREVAPGAGEDDTGTAILSGDDGTAESTTSSTH